MTMLKAYPWPGNVRELQNIITRAAIAAQGSEIVPEHLTFDFPSTETAGVSSGNDVAIAVVLKLMSADEQRQLCEYLEIRKAKGASISRGEMLANLKVNPDTFKRDIRKLTDAGLVTTVRPGHYVANETRLSDEEA